MTDLFKTVESPADDAFAITASNTTVFTEIPRAIYVGGAGNLAVVMASGETITFTGVVAGQVYPIRVQQVLSTGTTATGLVGLL